MSHAAVAEQVVRVAQPKIRARRVESPAKRTVERLTDSLLSEHLLMLCNLTGCRGSRRLSDIEIGQHRAVLMAYYCETPTQLDSLTHRYRTEFHKNGLSIVRDEMKRLYGLRHSHLLRDEEDQVQ